MMPNYSRILPELFGGSECVTPTRDSVDNHKMVKKKKTVTATCIIPAPGQLQQCVQCALIFDFVVRQRAAVVQMLAREDQALLVRREALPGSGALLVSRGA